MTRHLSRDLRTQSTISGYRRICEDLEAENQALRLQNMQMRALLARRAPLSPARPEIRQPALLM